MRKGAYFFFLAIGWFLVLDGLAGIIWGHMWTFRVGGYGPIPEHGRDARIFGVFYALIGAGIVGMASAHKALLLY